MKSGLFSPLFYTRYRQRRPLEGAAKHTAPLELRNGLERSMSNCVEMFIDGMYTDTQQLDIEARVFSVH